MERLGRETGRGKFHNRDLEEPGLWMVGEAGSLGRRDHLYQWRKCLLVVYIVTSSVPIPFRQ